MRLVRRFLSSTEGVTSIEYCLIAGLVSILIVIGVTSVGSSIYSNFYGPLGSSLN